MVYQIMDIKVSLILPSLNVVSYIKETLESAGNQTLKEIEILCIDAGSTDGTVEIIEKAAAEDSRIRLIRSEVKSYGYQVNLGIREASGKYIAVLETDDFVDVNMYRRLYEVAEVNKADYVKADYDAFFTQDDGSYYFFPRHTFSDRSLYDQVMEPAQHPETGRDDWYLWQGIYRRSFLIDNHIRFSESPGAAYQDIGFLFWTGVYGKRALYLRDILYHYRIDREGASSNSGKGLGFSYAEFKKMADLMGTNKDILPIQKKEVFRLLYARMSKSFVSCYSGISETHEDTEERRGIYDWFCGQLSDAIAGNLIDESLVQSGRWNRLMALLDSEETYFSKYSENRKDGFLTEHTEFAVFGCGDFGYKAYRKIQKLGKKVVLFLDNNEALWGKSLNGVRIVRPDEVLGLSEDTGVIIANESYHDVIRKQLLELGLLEHRMTVYK